MRKAILTVCVLWCSTALADLTVDVRQASTVVTSVTVDSTKVVTADGDQIGDEVLAKRDPVVTKGQPVAVMILNSTINFDVLKIKAKCDTAEVKKTLPNVFFVDKPGTHIVRFDTLSIDPFSWDDATVTVTVGPKPPGPDPNPGPFVPDFDNLASRANALAVQIPAPQRSQMVSILLECANKMQSYEFKRSQQATDYIARNWPRCETPACGQLFNLVADDAKSRLLSWQETQHYYRTLAAGIK